MQYVISWDSAHPNKFLVRRWEIYPSTGYEFGDAEFSEFDTIEEARASLPDWLSIVDHPTRIFNSGVEVWG